jgi:hypothetical protein
VAPEVTVVPALSVASPTTAHSAAVIQKRMTILLSAVPASWK